VISVMEKRKDASLTYGGMSCARGHNPSSSLYRGTYPRLTTLRDRVNRRPGGSGDEAHVTHEKLSYFCRARMSPDFAAHVSSWGD
jgi:hypothetical protein